MKLPQLALAASLTAVLLSGCMYRDRPAAADPHREWWTQHHPQEAYDRARAEQEHRDWCARTPDRSCEGWR